MLLVALKVRILSDLHFCNRYLVTEIAFYNLFARYSYEDERNTYFPKFSSLTGYYIPLTFHIILFKDLSITAASISTICDVSLAMLRKYWPTSPKLMSKTIFWLLSSRLCKTLFNLRLSCWTNAQSNAIG